MKVKMIFRLDSVTCTMTGADWTDQPEKVQTLVFHHADENNDSENPNNKVWPFVHQGQLMLTDIFPAVGAQFILGKEYVVEISPVQE